MKIVLILLLLVKLNISDDTSMTTQHMPYSCGQLKLKEVKKCWWLNPFCHNSYELHFYDLTTTNDTILGTADNVECIIYQLDPHGKEGEYTTMVRYEFKLFTAQPKPCQSSDTLACRRNFIFNILASSCRSLGFPSVTKNKVVARSSSPVYMVVIMGCRLSQVVARLWQGCSNVITKFITSYNANTTL